MHIRRLAIKEIPSAQPLVKRVFEQFEAPVYSKKGVDAFMAFIDPEQLVKRAEAGQLAFYGAFEQGVLAGVLAMRGSSHISLLFVDPALHRRGIARALMAALCDRCIEDGVKELTVNSSPYAVEIYKKMGFTPVSGECTSEDGITYTPMRKELCGGYDVRSARETAIFSYFMAWLDADGSQLDSFFTEDCVYTESYGPRYVGLEQIKRWFSDWNAEGRVLQWDIKRFFHAEGAVCVSWRFACEYKGKSEAFDGVTTAEFACDGRIQSLREYVCSGERSYPYGENR